MKVAFLEVDTERSWAVASIGPAFLGAHLRANGHEAVLVRATLEQSDDDVAAAVAATGADVLGVSLTTRQWLRGAHLVQCIRAVLPGLPVVAGGLHPTFAPEDVLAAPGFDFVCLGEGERCLLALVEALAAGARPGNVFDRRLASIPNLWLKGGTRPGIGPPFEPIDDLPFLARDLLDEPLGTVHMTTQRGCPFPCTYCAARMYDQLYAEAGAGDYGRRRSHRSVLDELHGLKDQGRLGYVIFLDDTFTLNRKWLREFSRLYAEELHTPFCIHARVETMSQGLIDELAGAGCQQVTYGIESGSERIRREVMHRPVTNDRFREVISWTHDAGIMVTANYMLGVPGETRADLQMTLDLAEELDQVLDFGYFVFYPYPGTQLFQVCRDQGYLPADYQARPATHRESILTLPDITGADIGEFYDAFTDLRRRRYLARTGEAPADVLAAATDHVTALASTG